MEDVLKEIKYEIKKNKLKELAQNSHITLRQIEIYLLWQKLREYNIKIENKIETIDKKKISIWSMYRILKQFRENIRKTLIDLIILDLIGVLSASEIEKISTISRYIREGLIDEATLKEALSHILYIHKR